MRAVLTRSSRMPSSGGCAGARGGLAPPHARCRSSSKLRRPPARARVAACRGNEDRRSRRGCKRHLPLRRAQQTRRMCSPFSAPQGMRHAPGSYNTFLLRIDTLLLNDADPELAHILVRRAAVACCPARQFVCCALRSCTVSTRPLRSFGVSMNALQCHCVHVQQQRADTG